MARNQHRQQRTLLKFKGSATSPGSESPKQLVDVDQHSAMSDAQITAMLSAVEAQLTQYFAAMSARADAVQLAGVTGRDELARQLAEKIESATRRFDELSPALAEQVAAATATLNLRVDNAGRAMESQVDDAVHGLSQRVDVSIAATRTNLAEQLATLVRKIDETDTRTIDRMVQMEARIDDRAGTRLADVEANVGRLSIGIDEAMMALSHRLGELENANLDMLERVEEFAIQVGRVDDEAIDKLSAQMSSAVGESMLVRIEMERLAAGTAENVDRLNVRIGELATQVAETDMDVSVAVQLDRLEEIERALIELDPAQFVRRAELDGSAVVPPPVARNTPPPPPRQKPLAQAEVRGPAQPFVPDEPTWAETNASESTLSSW